MPRREVLTAAERLELLAFTDLLLEVDRWTGFTRRFTHLKTGEPAKDPTLSRNQTRQSLAYVNFPFLRRPPLEQSRSPDSPGSPECDHF